MAVYAIAGVLVVTTGAMRRVAIVGTGPAGLYCAEALQASADPVHIDLFDRLPTPYGLLRGGVAPDHQRMKRLDKFYHAILTAPNTQYYGNIKIGHDINLHTLKNYYDTIILSYGAESPKPLPIPGSALAHNYAANTVVGWYNGHPDYADFQWQPGFKQIAIIGQGNVAIDIARLLAKTEADHRDSDMPESIISLLGNSAVTDIHLIGRRGPVQAAFTPLELKELGTLDCDIILDPSVLNLSKACQQALETRRKSQKIMAILAEFAKRPRQNARRRVHLHFFRQPIALHGDETGVKSLELGVTSLHATQERAVLTDQRVILPVNCVISSIGYYGQAMPGVPFDATRGIIPHEAGRVCDATIPGLYVSGWIKRGATGVIGSNKADALETVRTLLSDPIEEPAVIRDTDHLVSVLQGKGKQIVRFDDWLVLDQHEVARGKALGKPREKFTTLETLLAHSKQDSL